MFKLSVALIIGSCTVVWSFHWSYKERESWPELCRVGASQSPINFETIGAVESDFPKFVFKHYNVGYPAVVTNNGHSISVKIATPYPTLTGGGLPLNEYILDHLHFHWKSEHTLNGFRYPLEVHLVHYATQFENLSVALNHKGGVAVLGVFFDYSPDDDVEFMQLTEVMKNVARAPHLGINHMEGVFVNKYLPRDTAGFFRYDGSLTTPSCNEGVIWTVFTNTISISEQQVRRFLSVESDEGLLTSNYRPLQDLKGRTVYRKVSPLPHNVAAKLNNSHFLCILLASIPWMLLNNYN